MNGSQGISGAFFFEMVDFRDSRLAQNDIYQKQICVFHVLFEVIWCLQIQEKLLLGPMDMSARSENQENDDSSNFWKMKPKSY